MTLRDRMIYAGIRTSRKLARLSWFQRDFFNGLILVADDFGRFEADAEILRAVLYAPCLAKVTARDVQGALVACHQAGLVKLYQSGARGYGEVINFRQKLRERRALYPAEEAPPPTPCAKPEGGKEGRGKLAEPTFHPAGAQQRAVRAAASGDKPKSAWADPRDYDRDYESEKAPPMHEIRIAQ